MTEIAPPVLPPTDPAPAAPPLWRRARADLHLAISFLTRLPLPPHAYAEGGLGRAMGAFAPVGAGIGAVAGLVFLAAHALLPPTMAALLAIAGALILTGALHEDGLADFADGMGARGGPDERIRAMRDSAVGVFGILTLVFALALRVAALAAAPSGPAGLAALVAAGALSRAAIPVLMQVLPPARGDGLGAGAGLPHAGIAALGLALALAIAALVLGAGAALAAAAAAAAAALIVRHLARSRLGGFTGDVLGATAALAETAALVAVILVWR